MSEETIFNEVNEELRSERMRNLWRQYAPWVIGAAVLIVVLVAANEGWRWYQKSIAASASDTYYAAFDQIEDGDIAGAQETLNTVIANGAGSYPELARFAQAALLGEDGKTQEALAAFDALANSLSDQRLRELALLQSASLLVDTGDVTAVQSRLAGILDAAGPMRNLARELFALTQYAAGDKVAARETLQLIRLDPLATNDIFQRVDVYEAQLTAEGITEPVAALDESGVEAEAAE